VLIFTFDIEQPTFHLQGPQLLVALHQYLYQLQSRRSSHRLLSTDAIVLARKQSTQAKPRIRKLTPQKNKACLHCTVDSSVARTQATDLFQLLLRPSNRWNGELRRTLLPGEIFRASTPLYGCKADGYLQMRLALPLPVTQHRDIGRHRGGAFVLKKTQTSPRRAQRQHSNLASA